MHERTACVTTMHLILDDGALGGDVDTVEELADILVADGTLLVDESAGLGHILDIVTLDDDLGTGLGIAVNLDAVEGVNVELDLLANEVDNVNLLATVRDLDVGGEVSVHHLHAVLETLGHAGDHVLDVGAAGLDGGELLGLTEPLLDLDGLLVSLVEVDSHVLEALGESSTRAS